MKYVIISLFLLAGFYQATAQSNNDFFNDSKARVTFVGLDFSKAKMVGAEGFSNPLKIQSYYFPAWNGLFISEQDKYSIGSAFYKKNVSYETPVVAEVNKKVGSKNLVTNTAPKFFKKETLQGIVNKYDITDDKAEYGIAFIVHSFNKFEESAYIYVTIFNTKDKKIIFYEKMRGGAGGFGFRNYWAGAVHDVLEQIRKGAYRKWRKENS